MADIVRIANRIYIQDGVSTEPDTEAWEQIPCITTALRDMTGEEIPVYKQTEGVFELAYTIPTQVSTVWTVTPAAAGNAYVRRAVFGALTLFSTGAFAPGLRRQWSCWAKIEQTDQDGNVWATHVFKAELAASSLDTGVGISRPVLRLVQVCNANNLTT